MRLLGTKVSPLLKDFPSDTLLKAVPSPELGSLHLPCRVRAQGPREERACATDLPEAALGKSLLQYHRVIYSGTSRYPLIAQKRSQSTMLPNCRQ